MSFNSSKVGGVLLLSNSTTNFTISPLCAAGFSSWRFLHSQANLLTGNELNVPSSHKPNGSSTTQESSTGSIENVALSIRMLNDTNRPPQPPGLIFLPGNGGTINVNASVMGTA